MLKAEELDPSSQLFRSNLETQIYIVENIEDHKLEENVENQFTLKNILNASSRIIANEDRSFILFDLGSIISQFARWRQLMPRVYPFYAVKCMADKMILSLFGALGAGFDCASWDEIKNASMALNKPLGTFPEKNHINNSEKIIFSNPFKFENEMNTSCKAGVEFTVFDTIEELRLISTIWSSSKLLIRIKPPKRFKAYAQLGDKFGAEKSEIKEMIRLARKLNLNLCGVSFHVGSGVEEMDAWLHCVEYSVEIFQMMEENEFRPYLLDIGGGFPGLSMCHESTENLKIQTEFEEMCAKMNTLLDTHFPAEEDYLIIAEPGAYFMHGSGCLFFQIIGENESESVQEPASVTGDIFPPATHTYILNNSSYHSVEYGCPMKLISLKDYNRYKTIVDLESPPVNEDQQRYSSRLLGYAVDEHDCIQPNIMLPLLSVGDWLVALDKGAYTDVHNDLPTIFCSTTAVPHYYCISRQRLNDLREFVAKELENDNYRVLNSTNRDSVLYKVTRNCDIM